MTTRARTAWLTLALIGGVARAEIMTLHSNVRALGMGEAFTAVTRDQSALFYNPAGLALVEHFTWNVATARGGVSGLDSIKTISKLTKGGTNAEYANAINGLYGHGAWTGAGAESAIAAPNFGLAAFDHADARVRVDNPAYPSVYTGVYNDFGYVGGFSVPVAENVYFGTAFRYVKRTGARVPFGAATLADLDPKAVESRVTGWGRGFGADIGLDVVMPTPDFELTAAGTWRNVGQIHYLSADPSTSVPTDDNDVTLGLAATRDYFWGRGTFAVDYRYANDDDLQLLRKFNFGLELDFPLLDIRGGFREGYLTYGAGVDLGLFNVSAASYGVELGAYPGQLEDRRYVAELNVRLDIDETFTRYRRGRLKQRR